MTTHNMLHHYECFASAVQIAYAEQEVKPVVSDFDTFTIGSRGMAYEATPSDQVEIIHWMLDQTANLLDNPSSKGWMARWLDVIKEADANGFHPIPPKFGFGDPTSCALISDVVDVTRDCGAVRHGAECFNFWFPQELDDEFLVVWDGFSNPPWQSFSEPDLRLFLLARISEGFCLPINPVWPVRDPGWFEVLEALMKTHEGNSTLRAWFPPESGIMSKIEAIHCQHPTGFVKKGEASSLVAHFADRMQRKIDEMEKLAREAGADTEAIQRVNDMSEGSTMAADFEAQVSPRQKLRAATRKVAVGVVLARGDVARVTSRDTNGQMNGNTREMNGDIKLQMNGDKTTFGEWGHKDTDERGCKDTNATHTHNATSDVELNIEISN